MAYISEEEINNVRNNANIVDIISEYIPLKKNGSDYVGMCPFHDDHSPSMSVSSRLGIFKCFVCNTGGNVFTFVSKYENVSYPESIRIVASKCGIELHSQGSFEKKEKFQKEYDLMNLSLKFYQNNLATSFGKEAKEYLKSRGIDDNIIKNYKFGLSLGNTKLKEFLESKKENLELAYELGLLNKDGINYYDMFSNRIMIPIFDNQGHLVGYTARAYLKDEKNKYINSKETPIYKKSDILFNYYFAKDTARLNKELILVEGNMDAISLSNSGVKNVCALMGVLVHPKQIEAIKRLNSRVILVLDSDNAGSDATIKVGDQLYNEGINLYVVRLSGAKDPDEYIRKFGVDSFNDNVKHAIKYLDFKINYLKNNRNLNNSQELTEYIKEVIKSLEHSSELERDIVISKICNDYNIDKSIILNNLTPIEKKENKSVLKVKEKKSRYDLAVQELIYAMLTNNSFYKIYMDQLGYLKNKDEIDTAIMIGGYIKKHGEISISGFLDYTINQENVNKYVTKVLSSNLKENIDEKEFYDILDTVLKCINEEEIVELQEKIKKESDIAKKVDLINQLTELKKGCGNNEGN